MAVLERMLELGVAVLELGLDWALGWHPRAWSMLKSGGPGAQTVLGVAVLEYKLGLGVAVYSCGLTWELLSWSQGWARVWWSWILGWAHKWRSWIWGWAGEWLSWSMAELWSVVLEHRMGSGVGVIDYGLGLAWCS